MRGISRSSRMTSGTSSCICLAAMKGSAAAAITSMSGSAEMIAVSASRTEAESSTISTRMGLGAIGYRTFSNTLGAICRRRSGSLAVMVSE